MGCAQAKSPRLRDFTGGLTTAAGTGPEDARKREAAGCFVLEFLLYFMA